MYSCTFHPRRYRCHGRSTTMMHCRTDTSCFPMGSTPCRFDNRQSKAPNHMTWSPLSTQDSGYIAVTHRSVSQAIAMGRIDPTLRARHTLSGFGTCAREFAERQCTVRCAQDLVQCFVCIWIQDNQLCDCGNDKMVRDVLESHVNVLLNDVYSLIFA
jgi:hypothetical protein